MARLEYEKLFEASANPYMVLDRELRYVTANAAYLAVTGSKLEDLVGRYLFDAFPNDPTDPNNAPRRLLEESLHKVLATAKPDVLAHIPYRVNATGEVRIWSATHTPILDGDGEVQWILQHTQDVTELHRHASGHDAANILSRAATVQRDVLELDERLRTLRSMLDQAPGFVAFLRGPDHVFELTNAAYDALVGRRVVPGTAVRDALPDIETQGYYELLDRVFQSGEPFVGRGMRVELIREGATEAVDVYVDFLYQPIKDTSGATVGILVQGHDVTEQKRTAARQRFLTRASEALAAAATDLEGALEEVAWAAVEHVADWAICDLFEGAGSRARRLVVAHADPARKSLADALARYSLPLPLPPNHVLYGIDTMPILTSPLTESVLANAATSREHHALLHAIGFRSLITLPLTHAGRRYGALVLGSAESRRIFDSSDVPAMIELSRVIATALDNARLSRERAALLESEHEARQRAEAANASKDEFLAMLGHELRNPLAPIVTAVQLLKSREQTTPREVEIIERQTQHMIRLVDDLLDVSRIVHGKIELRQDRVELPGVIQRACELAGPTIAQRDHLLSVDAGPASLVVFGDEARLVQVIANLLTNAARYTPPGGRITVRAHEDAGDAVISVRDNGIGIAPEMLPRVFDLFVQGPRNPERSEGGLGLGLTLVRRLVELHGGRVEAHSGGTGAGSEFIVRLPRLAMASHAVSSTQPRALPVSSGQRIMVVDDNIDAAELLGELLAHHGHAVEVLHDGAVALEHILNAPPEIAVIDLGLPGLDGCALATRVRDQLGGEAPRMIALTGYGSQSDRARTSEAGFAAHLTKPVDSARLLELLRP